MGRADEEVHCGSGAYVVARHPRAGLAFPVRIFFFLIFFLVDITFISLTGELIYYLYIYTLF